MENDSGGAEQVIATIGKTAPGPLRPPVLQSASAILIDASSGQVLYEMNADVERPMASTTKIMTALLFCEAVPDDAIVTASERACKVRDSSLHLKLGEKVKAHDLLRAILMRSANDGCVAAAECAAGSESAFVDRMNARAAQLGALHTHFMNPHGLHDPNHYTTARDLATIGRAAMQVPRIEEVVRTEKTRIDRSINKQDITMRNHSHFLGHYPGADGIKTGWTIPAGHCYVGSATINGWRLISV
ncbi:MAG TPA: D-alanyl-D-alanine carboxypeptidase family protein, partial [Chthonomonadaceae bacterium]|nr:D-alanyl-D-alanine carboxypeptidase family protein [Chthonomonadaceae bacterium]